jgi:energy-coupling factor transport system substrate-specific component
MSWQLACFALLGLALAIGFAWYERSRPDARIVALVATLAAFAALGRIAFAAVPNVKPTTDIVLISGYALGGGPGFVVGALAGLTSNFFFGQGPWTPWQMAAWGATGLIGAGLATVTRGRITRWPLAIVCMVVGFAFTATQDLGDWVNYSDHSLGQLGVYVGKGLGFDAIHAAGCLAFALAFGPALTRSIARFAERLQVAWRTVDGAVVPLLAIACCAAALVAAPARAAGKGGRDPISYLLAAQHRDGGFGSSPGASSSQLYSGWVALGLAAAGRNPLDVSRGGRSLLAYVRTGGYPDTGSLERTILVVRASGASARSFGGHDLVAALQRRIRGDGSLSEQVNWTAFGVLALRSAGVAPPAKMRRWIEAQQGGDGGFSFASGGGGSDIDDTGAALEALGRGGGSHATRAIGYLRRHQNADGGFPSEPGGESNAQSTAWAAQGLLAAGIDPGSLHRRGAISPLAYLRTLTVGDGHVRYSRTSDQTPVWVTAQAVMALDRRPLPLRAAPRRVHRASTASATSAAAPTAGSKHAATGSVKRPSAGKKHVRSHRGARRSGAPRNAAPALLSYASDAAVITALVLAPVGAS